MINPNDTSIDIKDQRDWLVEHKSTSGMSWSQIEKASSIPAGTISQFGKGNYKGDNERVAREVFRYRQGLLQQSRMKIDAPDIPPYFETPTSKEIMNLLTYAQRGRLTFFAGGPGLGKTTTAEQYAESVSNAWIVTVLPSTDSLNKLCMAVLRAMGDYTGKVNSLTSHYLLAKLKNSGGLLIFDDAQHLDVRQIEEIRGWYDIAKVGVALFGNHQVVRRMQGGSRQAEFAQLFSRVGLRLIRNLPLRGDVEALADEWRIQDAEVLKLLFTIGAQPGGLRSCTHALEIAQMIARSKGVELSANHLRAAWTQLNGALVSS